MHNTLTVLARVFFPPPAPATAEALAALAPTARSRLSDVCLLSSNALAWEARRALIAQAGHSLDLAYFIVEQDESTEVLLQDLVAATRRGVQVRLLVDYLMSFHHTGALQALAGHPGFAVRQYRPPSPALLEALAGVGIRSDPFFAGLAAADPALLVSALPLDGVFPAHWISSLQPAVQSRSAAPLAYAIHVFGRLATLAGELRDWLPTARRNTFALQQLPRLVTGMNEFLHRTHHKLMLADQRSFIMGGRNLADAYQQERPAHDRPFWDLDVQGTAADGLCRAHVAGFQALWDLGWDVLAARAPVLPARQAPAPTLPDEATPCPTAHPLSDLDGCIVNGLSGAQECAITATYIQHIRALTARGGPGVIDIVSAYLFLDDDGPGSATLSALRDSLLAAAAAGITVNLRTNALASTDLKPVNAAFYQKVGRLIALGVRVFELRPGWGALHAKAAAIGDEHLLVGSYNLDPRSELYDSNNLLVLHDPGGSATRAFRRMFVEPDCWEPLTAEMAQRLQSQTRDSALLTTLFEPLL